MWVRKKKKKKKEYGNKERRLPKKVKIVQTLGSMKSNLSFDTYFWT